MWFWLSKLTLYFLPEYPGADLSALNHCHECCSAFFLEALCRKMSKSTPDKPNILSVKVFFSCFPSPLAVWTDCRSVFLSLTLYISVLAVGPDDWWWMNSSGTFEGHSTKRSAYVSEPCFLKTVGQDVKCVAADRCAHDNTNNNFIDPASKDENLLKLGRKGWDVA